MLLYFFDGKHVHLSDGLKSFQRSFM